MTARKLIERLQEIMARFPENEDLSVFMVTQTDVNVVVPVGYAGAIKDPRDNTTCILFEERE